MPKKTTKQSADVVAGIDAKIQSVIADIDAQLEKLEDRKAALLSLFGAPASKATRRGRPKGSKNVAKKAPVKAAKGKKRVFSDETKEKLKVAAEARWANARAEKAKAEKAKAKAKAEKAQAKAEKAQAA